MRRGPVLALPSPVRAGGRRGCTGSVGVEMHTGHGGIGRAGMLALGMAAATAGCGMVTWGQPMGMFPDASENATLDGAHREMRAVLVHYLALGAIPLERLSPQEARLQPEPRDAVRARLVQLGRDTTSEAVAGVQDRTIPGPGGPIPVRIYTPQGAGPHPVIVYTHGGTWVAGTVNGYDASARALTNAAQAIVVSVEYRKAPENRFPAAHDDAYAAYAWVLRNAASIGGDPARVATAGEGAGGNMALATAMSARIANIALPVHVLAIYPVADGDTQSGSYAERADAIPLSRPGMEWSFRNYLRTPADALDPRIALVRTDLRGMPPTTLILAEIDPLRSDGMELAERLLAAGVRAEVHTHEGVTHDFFGTAAVEDDAVEAVKEAGEALRASFGY